MSIAQTVAVWFKLHNLSINVMCYKSNLILFIDLFYLLDIKTHLLIAINF